MATWGEILQEISTTLTPQGAPDFDGVRRKHLRRVHDYTGRAAMIYASSFLESRPAPVSDLQLNSLDLQGLIEATSTVGERQLDLIIHSPGGSAEAAEAAVNFLRTRFDHIRVVVPHMAMSTATLIALAADEIVMAPHSQLGSIDPLLLLSTPEGARTAPAQAILDQFDRAREECREPENIAAWMPILRGYGPALLAECQQQQAMALDLATNWLTGFMFAGESGAQKKAKKIAAWFAADSKSTSYNRPIRFEEAQGLGLKVVQLESDPGLLDAVLSTHYATTHCLTSTRAIKIIESHNGSAFMRLSQLAMTGQGSPEPGPQPVPSRAERRRQERQR